MCKVNGSQTSWLPVAVVVPVAAWLHHVDLPVGGEAPVGVGRRHHPERGPDPVSQRQPRAPLNTTKTETELEKYYMTCISCHWDGCCGRLINYIPTNFRVEPGELNWLDNILSWAVAAEIILVIPNVARMLWVLQKILWISWNGTEQ